MSKKKHFEWYAVGLVLLAVSGLVLFATTQRTYKSEDAVIFALPMLYLPPMVLLVSREEILIRLLRVYLVVLYWPVFYDLYVDYQNHPWFAVPPPGGCDGPCFGWYSFENRPIPDILVLLAMLSTSIGLSMYGVYRAVCVRR